MALGGRDPVLIINLKVPQVTDFFNSIPVLGSFLADAVPGVPIPIPLNERVGVYVDSENSSVDIDTRVEPTVADAKKTGTEKAEPPPIVTQTTVGAQISVNMFARNDSTILVVLLALMEQLLKRVANGAYSITYVNGPTVIFGARLVRFAKTTQRNTDLIQMEMALSTATKEEPTQKSPKPSLPKSPPGPVPPQGT